MTALCCSLLRMDVHRILHPSRCLLHCLNRHEAGLHLCPKIASFLDSSRRIGIAIKMTAIDSRKILLAVEMGMTR
jgi:hypothetical protein